MKIIFNFKDGLPKHIVPLDKLDDIFLIATRTLEGRIKRRVFNKGIASNGLPIGTYKEYKAYFGRDKFVQESKFKPLPNRKTMTFNKGWQELRQLQDRQTSKVDLNYSGALQLSIQTFQNRRELVIAITSKDGATKRAAMEKLYGDIFTPSKTDIEAYQKALNLAYEKAIQKP